MVIIIYTVAIQLKNTIYCKPFEVEKFVVEKLNCNSLENIHGRMVGLYGQSLLHTLFHWKILQLPIDSWKTQNFSTMNDLQYTLILYTLSVV